MGKIRASLKHINWKLYFALLLMGLIPTIYTTVRIFFLGELPDSYGFSIASQLSWINLLYEIIQETIILPLFFFIGAVVLNKKELENRVKSGMMLTFAVYLIVSIIIILFAKQLITLMAQNSELIDKTVVYIRLETVANIFITLVKFIVVVLVTMKKEKYLYVILLFQMFLSIFFDTFFVSSLTFSLKLGVNGVALSNIISNILVLVLSFFFLSKEGVNVFNRNKIDYSWFKKFAKIGVLSGMETFVRNFAFMMMVLRMVNVVGEQGVFWVANNFIWGWLLLPIIQLGELVKRDCGEKGIVAIKNNTIGYFVITTIIVILWFVSFPLWEPFLKNVLKLSNYKEVLNIVIISIGFYVLFAYNNVIDSIFYGIGKTSYMLFQSIVINVIVYGTAFVLYVNGIYKPTLIKIALMFAGGTALDSILTYFIFAWMLRKRKINILNIE